MTRRKYLFALIAGLALTMSARAQQSHVEVRYDKDVDITVVTSDALYVVNMPGHFVQAQLTGHYRKQGKPTEAPTAIGLQFFSYAPKAVYQLDDAHRLRVKADDQILDLGLLAYSKIDEKSKASSTRTNSSARAALPESALVRAASKSEGLTLEIMSVRTLSLADLHTLAKAESVVMKIGDTVFPLKPIHLTILRQFVEAITAPGVDVAAGKKPATFTVPADVPSDANKTSLDDTLRWMKTHMDRESSDKGATVLISLETLKFKDCKIGYRLMPRYKNPPTSNLLAYVVTEFQINLSDINPEIVTIANHGDYASVSMTTRDVQPKIIVFDHKNESSTMGTTVNEHKRTRASISFKDLQAAQSFSVALIHAIKLCTR